MTSPQPPQKDFLALTHGQEWVNFYESFDLLVQDHLSRSSDLLRRAMSLPEVADREVAQVRDDLEGKLAAERERTNGLLTDLKAQISNSHRLASTLAMSIGSLMTDLHSLNSRVDEALQASAQAAPAASAPASAPAAPTGLLSASQTPAPTFAAPSAPGTDYRSGAGSPPSAPFEQAAAPVAADEPSTDDSMMTSEANALNSDAVASLADEPVMDVADLAEVADAGADAPIDLTAIAEAEESSSDDPAEIETAAESEQSFDDGEAAEETTASETGERQRPHWLSVTRVGASRP